MTRNRGSPTVSFLDICLNGLVGFIVLFCFVFALVALMVMKKAEENKNQIPAEGEFMITVQWNDKSYDDVDTYVRDPNGKIVFFKNRDQGLMHLERDDLGIRNDVVANEDGTKTIIEKNEERVIIRGIVVGEYIVNVHMYNKEGLKPTTVTIKLIDIKGSDRELTKKEVVLPNHGSEKTAFRFTLNSDRSVSNINDLHFSFMDLVPREEGE